MRTISTYCKSGHLFILRVVGIHDCSEPRLALSRTVVVRYRMRLESRVLAANTINQQLADYAMLAMLFGCGFRRSEVVVLEMDEVQMRQGDEQS